MRALIRVLVLASALACSSQLLAQELTVSSVKAFTAKIDAAIARGDIDTVIDHIAELCIISGTGEIQGQMVRFRMNKAQYRQLLTLTLPEISTYTYERTNEKVSIERDQAIVTADVTETKVVDGRQITTKAHERATVENIDGRLMLTQLVSNQAL